MEIIYMYGEGFCRTENKAGKCRTVRRNAGRIATLLVVLNFLTIFSLNCLFIIKNIIMPAQRISNYDVCVYARAAGSRRFCSSAEAEIVLNLFLNFEQK